MSQFLATAFGAGLATLLTPCVFPMIPVTLAFFTKQSAKADGGVDRRAVMKLAAIYCLGIILSFVAIGVGFAVLVGKTGAFRFATNPWVNLTFAALFVLFGLAMLELFELKLPASLQNAVGGRKSGTIGVLFMGLTFVISAFTCTAPFLGTIIAQAASAKGESEALLRPILGMATFASALALPFFMLALFPPLLSKLPRSGAWMTTVKGVFGFIELAAALKFLSNADLAWSWGLLSREVFLVLTTLCLAAGGLWLLGFLKIGHTPPSRPATPARIGWAALLVGLGAYCLYGIKGRIDPLMETYVPPYRLGSKATPTPPGGVELVWNRYLDRAMAQANAEGKRIFIDFTGHT